MEYRKLGNLDVSVIGLGTLRTFDVTADDEVAGFVLWPAGRALRRAQETDDFKFNVPLTLIEFGIRHGLIGPDDPDYLALLRGLIGRTQSYPGPNPFGA